MAVNNFEDSDAFQFEECYELAAKYEKQDVVRDIIYEKIEKINIPHNFYTAQLEDSFQGSEMQVLSEAICEFAYEGSSAFENSDSQLFYTISALPSSSEKEYLLALLSLRSGTNETQRLDALRHIRVALEFSPNDPRYIALANVLLEVDT